MRTTMTFSQIRTQKQPTVKPQLKQRTKETANSMKQRLQRKTETGKLGNGGGNPERLMKVAHAYKIGKRKQGLMKAQLRMKRLEKIYSVCACAGRQEAKLNTLTKERRG